MTDFHRTDLGDDWAFVRGAARLLINDTTVSFPEQIQDIIEVASGSYDAQNDWEDLGATNGGITISIAAPEEVLGVNQETGIVEPEPQKQSCKVSTNLGEMTLENIQKAWNTGEITESAGERSLSSGTPHTKVQKRLAVLFKNSVNNLIRAFIFRKVEINVNSQMGFNKTGPQQSLGIEFVALPDFSILDIKKRFFMIYEQIQGQDESEEGSFDVGSFGDGSFGSGLFGG